MAQKVEMIVADWTPPFGVHACVTTRVGGVSLPPFDHLNLATHVGDDPLAVAENRAQLRAQLSLPSDPLWLIKCMAWRSPINIVPPRVPIHASRPMPLIPIKPASCWPY